MIGRMKGARSESMKTVSVSVIFSTKASSPGIFSIVADIALTTLSRNSKMGYHNVIRSNLYEALYSALLT